MNVKSALTHMPSPVPFVGYAPLPLYLPLPTTTASAFACCCRRLSYIYAASLLASVLDSCCYCVCVDTYMHREKHANKPKPTWMSTSGASVP